jgi:leucyl/phenylalanyl-tRNA---protein transferase
MTTTPYDIDVTSILDGYRQGYFLMADEQTNALCWYASRARTLIPLDHRFHYPKSLQRVLNQNRFSTAIDQDFLGVVEGCAQRETTWISEDLKHIYALLHRAGWAHSFETWQGDRLAGGILCIVIGSALIGESMFYNISEGSKVALVKLVEHLRRQKFQLFDAQLMNPHLARFGAYQVTDKEYRRLLNQSISFSRPFP